MIADAYHVIDDRLLRILECEPVDELTFVRAGAFADVVESLVSKRGGLEAVGEQTADHIVGKEFHSAIGVMNDEELARAEQFVRDHEGANGVVAGAAACVPNYVCVTLA